MASHEEAGYGTARTRGLTAVDVSVLDYRGVAELCDVTIDEKGNSPADFFWHVHARQIQAELQADADELAQLAQLQIYRDKFAALPVVPAIIIDQEGDFRLFMDGTIPSGVVEKTKWRPAATEAATSLGIAVTEPVT